MVQLSEHNVESMVLTSASVTVLILAETSYFAMDGVNTLFDTCLSCGLSLFSVVVKRWERFLLEIIMPNNANFS